MDFSLNEEQRQLQALVAKVCSHFDDAYWQRQDADACFPRAFYRAVADAGLLGVAMPADYGGAALGITEASIMMQAIAQSGAGMAGASAVHMNIFGLQPVVVYGSATQKSRMLPGLIRGDEQACFAVTEPDSGLNTTAISTKAVRQDNHYLVSGQKTWISTAQIAHKVLLLARTAPREESLDKTKGLSLFYTDLDRGRAEVKEIAKLGRHAVDSNTIFFDRYEVPAEDLIGEEGEGFRQILHSLNPERILIAAEAVGIGLAAVSRAAGYARERIVFDRPIGQNQAIQHPLARCWMNLQAAQLMVHKAATLYDNGASCGAEANTAKYLAGEAAFNACETAVMTLGGMGYAADYHVERYLRESLIPRIAPVSPQMILNYVAERVLGLPKSY